MSRSGATLQIVSGASLKLFGTHGMQLWLLGSCHRPVRFLRLLPPVCMYLELMTLNPGVQHDSGWNSETAVMPTRCRIRLGRDRSAAG